MSDNLFIQGIQAPDPTYNIIRDSQDEDSSWTRSFIEGLWQRYNPYADRHFRQQMAVDMDSRFWEMYLACTILEKSIHLSSADIGPDIFIENHNARIWIEAIAPTSGADPNPDKVPAMKIRVATKVPDDKIVLRYCSAIREKYDNKYRGYVEDKLIQPSDAYVIAINSCKIPMGIMETDTPRILKAVFPIGNWQITINRRTGAVINQGHHSRHIIKRAKGAEIMTDLFLNPEYAGLSGVLYSRTSVRSVGQKMGEDFVLVHNPLATNKIPHGFLKCGREYIPIENDNGYTLEVTNWN